MTALGGISQDRRKLGEREEGYWKRGIGEVLNPSRDRFLRNDIMRNIELHRPVQYYTDKNQKSLRTKDIPS